MAPLDFLNVTQRRTRGNHPFQSLIVRLLFWSVLNLVGASRRTRNPVLFPPRVRLTLLYISLPRLYPQYPPSSSEGPPHNQPQIRRRWASSGPFSPTSIPSPGTSLATSNSDNISRLLLSLTLMMFLMQAHNHALVSSVSAHNLLFHGLLVSLPLLLLFWELRIFRYASIRAIESPSKLDDEQWLAYWILYSFITLVEIVAEPVLHWYLEKKSIHFV